MIHEKIKGFSVLALKGNESPFRFEFLDFQGLICIFLLNDFIMKRADRGGRTSGGEGRNGFELIKVLHHCR